MVKTKDVSVGRNTRKSFAKINEVMQMPNLIEVQKKSYEQFLETGIAQALKDMGEIVDFNDQFALGFDGFRLGTEPKYDIKECKKREATYAVPLYFQAYLRNKQTDEIKTSDIYIGEFPKMTDSGTFIINGAERVVISQLVRSPGVYFGMTHDKTGKELYSTTVIPNRGAWLEFETDQNDMFFVKIDKQKKIPITTFIKSLSFITKIESDEEILEFFGGDERIATTLDKVQREEKDGKRSGPRNGTEALIAVYKVIRPGEPPTAEVAETTIRNLFFDTHRYDLSKVGRYKYNKKLGLADRLRGRVLAEDVISPDGEVIAEKGTRADLELAKKIEQAGVKSVYADIEGVTVKIISNHMVEAGEFFPMFTAEELEAIGVTEKVAYSELQTVLDEIEGIGDKDEISAIIEKHLDRLIPNHITIDDIFASINYLDCTAHKVGNFDDIDHLGNRRIRCVGELLQNQLNIGLSNLSKAVREKFSLHTFAEPEKLTPVNLVNTRVIISKVREFFGSSPLSQFMDQTNPLAELTHKRRLSALGPGGLSRDRAGFEVRDVHYSHYGRMCPIESPEGGNIGLISYLATFARINKYGFVEAPFRKVDKATGKVLDEVEYMTADREDEYFVAQANEELDENSCFVNDRITCRCRSDFRDVDRTQVDYMDVSPRMVFSVATGMIPFLEHDDANRALMGANMQRQAVPLLRTEAPFVGTGMEYKAACDSGVCVLAKRAGRVEYVCADKIIIETADGERDTYDLMKFMRSNASTCTNQKPIVAKGDFVKENEVIADGPATCEGEIALGKNALIGFMTWEGYNYEDAVLLNERLVREDVYTSIHIDKYEVEARETKLGPESITRDIPQVGENALANLDENGIIYIGAEVKDNDILVGKVTPKAEQESTPEERLLRAIFGEKAKEYKDTSLRLPHGSYGIVIDVDTYTRDNSDELGPGVNKIVRVYVAQKRKISVGDKMAGRHGNKGVVSRILPEEDMPFLEDGTPLDIVLNPLGVPSRMNVGQVLEVTLGRACRELGWKIMTPIFDGAQESDIVECLRQADEHAKETGHACIAEDGKSWLYDGRTGERFDNRITVGVMYFLKLHHLVDDKIHARSTGPYSLVTQQPLGGKAQFGGQRFGEMEVWALEAYGAAYTLQEILTIKSDDIIGRRAAFSAIVEGENIPRPGVPESFKVLVKELQALGLDIRAYDDEDAMIDLTQDYDDDDTPAFTAEDIAKAQADSEIDTDDIDFDDDDTDDLMGAGKSGVIITDDFSDLDSGEFDMSEFTSDESDADAFEE